MPRGLQCGHHGNTNQKSSDCGSCFLKKWREIFFVLACKFFNCRAKTKKISRHAFVGNKCENSGTQTDRI
ncbi:hypothetical protein CS543_09955 [Porphyromonas gingivalis]|nr:hypothetical protein CS543_09955 [Porphyromonas gingivalis]